MKYFLDSANFDKIIYAYKNWDIDVVITNPKHIKASRKPFFTVIRELAEEFKEKPDFPISIEINPYIEKADEMIKEIKKLSALSENFIIKIPCNEQGLIAARRLTEEDIKVNVTLVFTVTQAIQVGRIGAIYCKHKLGMITLGSILLLYGIIYPYLEAWRKKRLEQKDLFCPYCGKKLLFQLSK